MTLMCAVVGGDAQARRIPWHKTLQPRLSLQDFRSAVDTLGARIEGADRGSGRTS
ncbi:MAG: hypothetical protein WKF83_15465 [Nocardioidaceae bacterium]